MAKQGTISYCEYVSILDKNNIHKIYHDNEYGFPIQDDNELFGRLILEINQAGLSWETILKKQSNFRVAFSKFDIKKIAKYDDIEINRLLSDRSIIRNKLKIRSIIFNAKQVISIQRKFGSLQNWLNNNKTKTIDEWIALFKITFKFTGREITKEFLLSTGLLKGAHTENCPINNKIQKIILATDINSLFFLSNI